MVRSTTDVTAFVVECHSANLNCFYTLNPISDLTRFARSHTGKQPRPKPGRADIAALEWLHVDVDPRPHEDLSTEQGRISSMLRLFKPAPTFVVFSGGGYQAAWRLSRPIPLDGTRESADRAADYSRALEAQLNADATHNVDRLMRLPGTVNFPNAKKQALGRVPTLARVVQGNWSATLDLATLSAGALMQVSDASTAGSAHVSPIDFTALPQLNSVDDLDRWGVASDVKQFICTGPDLSDPRQSAKPKARDRSRGVLWASCELLRSGVPRSHIAAALLNPAFYINAHIREQRDPLRAVTRAIEKAIELVDKESPLLSAGDPARSAREFLRRERPHLRHFRREWLDYDGAAYTEVPTDTIKAHVHRFLKSARTRTKEAGVVPFTVNRSKKLEVLDSLADESHVADSEYEPPCWIEGSGPPPDELLACRNGILQLPTQELLEPSPRLFTRNALDIEYQPGAGPPARWLRFMHELWPKDSGEIRMLEEVLGYLLVPDTTQEKIFLLVGPPRSGKGTIAAVVEALVGTSNVCYPTLQDLSSDFGLQPLIGKQLAVVSDMKIGPRTDRDAITQNLLRISGRDAVNVNRKYLPPWIGRLATRFLILSNEMPRLMNDSGALAKRYLPLQIRESFYGREDLMLRQTLMTELAGILNCAISGWQRLQEAILNWLLRPRR